MVQAMGCRQAIILTNADHLSLEAMGTNCDQAWIKIRGLWGA